MLVLGINAAFHDPAAALVVDGRTAAAAEEERFSRRKHGKPAVPFSTWELPEAAARWCLEHVGAEPGDLDAVAYTAGRPIVDDVRDALECFGSSPIDALAIGPYLVRR